MIYIEGSGAAIYRLLYLANIETGHTGYRYCPQVPRQVWKATCKDDDASKEASKAAASE